MIRFCEVTNETLTTAMDYDISTLFYIVSYDVMRQKEYQKNLKNINRIR